MTKTPFITADKLDQITAEFVKQRVQSMQPFHGILVLKNSLQ